MPPTLFSPPAGHKLYFNYSLTSVDIASLFADVLYLCLFNEARDPLFISPRTVPSVHNSAQPTQGFECRDKTITLPQSLHTTTFIWCFAVHEMFSLIKPLKTERALCFTEKETEVQGVQVITPSSVHQSWPEENQAEPKISASNVQARFHPKSKKDIQCLTKNRAIAPKVVCTGQVLPLPS